MKKIRERLNRTFFVKFCLMGLLLLFLLIGVVPARAAQVIVGAIPESNANYLIGVTYRSFGNTPDPEAILEVTPLDGSNQVTENFAWSKSLKNFFKFTYDPIKREISTVVFQIDPASQDKTVSPLLTYAIPSNILDLDLLKMTMMKITVVCMDPGAKVSVKNVKLNGTRLIPYDDFIVAAPSPGKDWTVKGFDFKKGFVFTGEIGLTGDFGTTPEMSYVAMAVGYKKNNTDPLCAEAYPNPGFLWPPNHDFHPIDIAGISDEDGDSVSLLVTKILQDEPLNAQGDGNFIPDAIGIEARQAWLRSERAGGGDGRVYHIYFEADDGFGGSCAGEIKVGVPKSQGVKDGPVDGGPIYNSTLQSLSFSPRFLRFLYQEVETTSIRQTVTMTNITPDALNSIAFEFEPAGPFAIVYNGCSTPLLAGESCTFAVTFTPAAEGIFKGSIRVTSSAADSPDILRLWGMGGYLLIPGGQGIFREGDWFFDQNKNLGWDGISIDKHLGKFGGYPGDIPVMGDWNGDGEKEIGIYRRGAWYLDFNGNGEWDGCDIDSCIPAFGGFPWDIPVVGDWNGDGKTNIGIYRNGAWYLDKNGNEKWDGCALDFCLPAFGGLDIDKPLIGDWNGSGVSKVGIYRQGLWYLDMNGNGAWDGCDVDACIGPFGGFEVDKPVVGDWKGDGIGRIGIYRNGLWYLDLNGNGRWDGCEIDLCAPAFGGLAVDHPLVK